MLKNEQSSSKQVSSIFRTLGTVFSKIEDASQPMVRQIVEVFTTGMKSDDDNVCFSALECLNALVKQRPELLADSFDAIIELTASETVVNEELVKTVAMGPFKHKVDKGLDRRSMVYDMIGSILSSPYVKLQDLSMAGDMLLRGLEDEYEIKKICCNTICKLCEFNREILANRNYHPYYFLISFSLDTMPSRAIVRDMMLYITFLFGQVLLRLTYDE